MHWGHADAQRLFADLGRGLGYRIRRTWSRGLPTDGVWLLPRSEVVLPEAPAVAIEVVVSEGPKTIKGSLDTLAEISPAIGILLINEVEIRRLGIRAGMDTEALSRRVDQMMCAARERAKRHQQRLEIWTYEQLARKHQLICNTD